MNCGIYKIKNIKTNYLYIGKSVNIKNRFVRHKTELKHNKHRNNHLQNSYNKYGKDCFEYSVLELCDKNQLPIYEQKWIDCHPKDILYNSKLYVIDLHNERNPFYGKKHTDETKLKLSLNLKGKFAGEKNPNYGKKHDTKSKLIMSECNGNVKLTKLEVLEIADLLRSNELSQQEIANKYNIARTAITRICNGTRWSNITGGPIRAIEYVDGKRKFNKTHAERIGKSRIGMKYKTNKKG